MVAADDGGGDGGSWRNSYSSQCHGRNSGGGVGGYGGASQRRRLASRAVACSFLGCSLVAAAYTWLVFRSSLSSFADLRTVQPRLGCGEDDQGSWAIGVFYGDSPFSLRPIETTNKGRNDTAGFRVANPVITCASISDSGFPSNFVADPFLYIQGDTLYVFYETKNSLTMQGDIGVAKSTNNGATWEHLGIALDEDWHLSYPYVFNYLGNIYMMPESSDNGQLRLYRAIEFPLKWKLDRVMIKKPLVDTVMINRNGRYWLFGSDRNTFGARKNGDLEIWYSSSPLGPWAPHKENPIHNKDDSFGGARNGGRPFVYNRNLYRIGQDCGETYGRRVRIFKVETLTRNQYKEVEVSFPFEEIMNGRSDWNSARYHHLDVQQLSSGEWIAVMDGDSVPSLDSAHRFILGCIYVATVVGLIVLLGVIFRVVKCIILLNWCVNYSGKRRDALLTWEKALLFYSKVRKYCCHINKVLIVVALIFCIGIVVFIWIGVKYIYGGNGAKETYSLNNHHSQFTILIMTYDARLWNLKLSVEHYSWCPSVKEIVVVWNRGTPPKLTDLNSNVPIRIRLEEQNSLNNRFKMDPLIETRGVLELDDDLLMSCDDIERGFRVWQQHPDRIVGFYPRYANPNELKYTLEDYAHKHGGYNMILTGAAFIDSQLAFKIYWSDEAKSGREVVDKLFNCEDVLLNFLYANASSSTTVEYVKPSLVFSTEKFSKVGISWS